MIFFHLHHVPCHSLLTEVEPVLIVRGDRRRGPGTQQLEVLHRTLVGVFPRAVAVGRLRGALPKVGRTAIADDPPFALTVCWCYRRWACGWRPRVGSVHNVKSTIPRHNVCSFSF